MALLDWNDSYSVRIPTIDAQHRHLFDLLNKLHDAMSAGKSNTVLGSVLQEWISYVATHFEAEEGILQKHRYPMLSEHRKQHKEPPKSSTSKRNTGLAPSCPACP
jgi:hemerythrin